MKKFFKVLLSVFLTLSVLLTGVGCGEGEKEAEYTLTFNADGGQVALSSKKVTFGQAVGGLPIPEKEGYKFSHWLYEENEFILTSDTIWYFRKDITVKAVYIDASKYLIGIDLNGGKYLEGDSNPYEYDASTPTFTLKNPIKVGFKFIGWTSEDILVPSLVVSIETGQTGDKNFIANWEEVQGYTVNLNLNCFVDNKAVSCTYKNNVTFNPVAVVYNDTVNLLEIDVLTSGYEFVGIVFVGDDGLARFVTARTVFNEQLFGENREITLNVVCKKAL